MNRILISLLLTSLALLAQAAEPLKLRPGMTGLADLGAASCQTFNDMHPFGPVGLQQAALTWAQGYIYARSGKTLDQVLAELPADADWSFDSLSGHVVDYCAANPEAGVADAVVDLWTTIERG